MKYFILLILAITTLKCSESTEPDTNVACETVINAQGPSFLKVINRYNSTVEVFLPDYAFSAELRSGKCEIYGVGTGTWNTEISICVNNDCGNISNTKTITFSVKQRETYTIEVTQAFFGN